MANLTKLKPKSRKGIPPAPEETNNNLQAPAREKSDKKTVLQFSIPETIQREFSSEAGHRFGFKKGSKSDLFVAMWEAYKNNKS